jgi:molybdopterin-guanine dinucleotide biosynthesis protein B
MPPVLCVVGRPGSGSQAVVEGLVRELTAKGVRVATVVEAEKTPADGEYMAAGAEMTIVKAPGLLLTMRRLHDEPSLDELVWEMRDDYDLVLADGFRHSSYLKLEVHRAAEGDDLLCHKNELLAIAGDKPAAVDVPAFAADDFPHMADLVRRASSHRSPANARPLHRRRALPLALFVPKLSRAPCWGWSRPLKA